MYDLHLRSFINFKNLFIIKDPITITIMHSPTKLYDIIDDILNTLKKTEPDRYEAKRYKDLFFSIDELRSTLETIDCAPPKLIDHWHYKELRHQVYSLYSTIVLNPRCSFHYVVSDNMSELFHIYEIEYNNATRLDSIPESKPADTRFYW